MEVWFKLSICQRPEGRFWAVQKQEDGVSRLKRVILIGDHHQLPPVVKNMAFQKYSHLDQSLFTRFVRLGTPFVQLDAQVRILIGSQVSLTAPSTLAPFLTRLSQIRAITVQTKHPSDTSLSREFEPGISNVAPDDSNRISISLDACPADMCSQITCFLPPLK